MKMPNIEYKFKTIEDLHVVPLDKIPALCRDLELWLSVIRIAESESEFKVKNRSTFGWIDDNRHDVNITVTVNQKPKGVPDGN
jgi:hypothetical protein